MIIRSTKKLMDELGLKPTLQKEESPLFSWHANLITIGRKKAVVMVNDSSRYAIVLFGLKKRDFQNLRKLILQAIVDAFREECIDDEVAAQYISGAGEILFAKAVDRSSLARVNKAAGLVDAYYDYVLEDSIIQSPLSIKISRMLVGAGKGSKEYKYPNEELYADLEELCKVPALRCRAAVMNVRLDLECFDVWRRIIVPLNYTFEMLHKTLQAAFGWKDWHLHEFFLYIEKAPVDIEYINHPGFHKDGYKPLMNLVCDEEAFAYPSDVPMRMENEVRISDCFELGCKSAKYVYDLGDDWQHYIEIEEVIDDFRSNYPVCLEGIGDTPPEDVGGESGYENFVRAMADENDPEHYEYVLWSKGTGYEGFDIEKVNRRLKFVFR